MSFEPGQSGNPAGRPIGRPDKRTQLRELLTPHAKDLVAKVVEMAKEGDISAIRLVLDRLLPPLKAIDEPVVFKVPGGSMVEQGRLVISALGAGELTPDQAAAVLSALAAQGRIVETGELADRIAELEKLLDASGIRK